MNKLVTIGAILFINAADASGGVTMALHQGAADPATEGFTLASSGAMLGDVGPVLDDGALGLDAWFTDDQGTNSGLAYSAELSEEQAGLMIEHGFRLATLMRSPTLSDETDLGMTLQVEVGDRRFLLRFGASANGIPLVSTNDDATIFAVAGPVGAYHLYELIDDDADGDVDFYIDGALRRSDIAGVPASRRVVTFGDTSTTPGAGGRAHWSMVVLEALGGACVGDVDGDGFIGFADLNAIISVFNTTCPIGCAEDVSGDGSVGFADLNIVVSSFNSECR